MENLKRIISLVLAFLMVFGSLGNLALAEDIPQETPEEVVSVETEQPQDVPDSPEPTSPSEEGSEFISPDESQFEEPTEAPSEEPEATPEVENTGEGGEPTVEPTTEPTQKPLLPNQYANEDGKLTAGYAKVPAGTKFYVGHNNDNGYDLYAYNATDNYSYVSYVDYNEDPTIALLETAIKDAETNELFLQTFIVHLSDVTFVEDEQEAIDHINSRNTVYYQEGMNIPEFDLSFEEIKPEEPTTGYISIQKDADIFFVYKNQAGIFQYECIATTPEVINTYAYNISKEKGFAFFTIALKNDDGTPYIEHFAVKLENCKVVEKENEQAIIDGIKSREHLDEDGISVPLVNLNFIKDDKGNYLYWSYRQLQMTGKQVKMWNGAYANVDSRFYQNFYASITGGLIFNLNSSLTDYGAGLLPGDYPRQGSSSSSFCYDSKLAGLRVKHTLYRTDLNALGRQGFIWHTLHPGSNLDPLAGNKDGLTDYGREMIEQTRIVKAEIEAKVKPVYVEYEITEPLHRDPNNKNDLIATVAIKNVNTNTANTLSYVYPNYASTINNQNKGLPTMIKGRTIGWGTYNFGGPDYGVIWGGGKLFSQLYAYNRDQADWVVNFQDDGVVLDKLYGCDDGTVNVRIKGAGNITTPITKKFGFTIADALAGWCVEEFKDTSQAAFYATLAPYLCYFVDGGYADKDQYGGFAGSGTRYTVKLDYVPVAPVTFKAIDKFTRQEIDWRSDIGKPNMKLDSTTGYSATNVQKEYGTDGSDTNGLPLGDYTLSCIEPPLNYKPCDPINFKLTPDDMDKNNVVEIEFEYNSSITVKKILGDDGLPLSNVGFSLYQKQADGTLKLVNGEQKTGEDGTVVFSGMPNGDYVVIETSTPDGIEPDKKPIEVKVEANSQEFESTSNAMQQQIVLNKWDIDGEKGTYNFDFSLAGAKFEVKRIEGIKALDITRQGINQKYYMTTDKTGNARIKLTMGVYEIKEVEAPEGFELNNEVKTVTLKPAEGATTNTIPETINNPSEIVRNEKDLVLPEGLSFSEKRIKGDLTLVKYSEKDLIPIKGVVFQLYNQKKEPIFDPVTGKTNPDNERQEIVEWKDLDYGTYFVKEVKAPAGYDPITEFIEFKVPRTNDGAERINNNLKQFKVEIDKHSASKKDIKIKDVKFRIEALTLRADIPSDVQQEIIEQFNAGRDTYIKQDPETKHYVYSGLMEGSYLITELESGVGYTNDKFTSQTIIVNDNNADDQKVIKMDIANTLLKDKTIEITLVDKETGKPLKNGEFIIERISGTPSEDDCKINEDFAPITGKTDENGKIIVPNLPYGEYKITQKNAPDGYHNDNDNGNNEKTVTIKTDNDKTEIKFENDAITGTLNLSKKAKIFNGFEKATEGEYKINKPVFADGFLKGSEFGVFAKEDIKDLADGEVLHHKDDLVGTITTTGAEKDSLEKLKIGKYYVKETKASLGYKLNENIFDIEVKDSKQNNKVEMIDLNVENDYVDLDFSFTKKKEMLKPVEDKENVVHNLNMVKQVIEQELAGGIVFGLYNTEDITLNDNVVLAKDSLVAVATSDENGIVKFTGKYPKAKYYVKELKTDKNHKLIEGAVMNIDFTDTQTVDKTDDVVNELICFDKVLNKIDKKTGKGIAGGVIEVYDGETLIFRGVTNENGQVNVKLLAGKKYTFKQVISPEGYELNPEPKDIDVDDDGKITGDDKVEDDYTRVKIQKYNETDKPLEGVEFSIIRKSDNSVVLTSLSDKDGVVTFEKIPYGEFTIKETKAKQGYVLSPIEISLTVDGTFINPKEHIAEFNNHINEIYVKVVDEQNKPIKDTKFGVFDKDGNKIQDGISDENGLVKFSALPDGDYEIRQIEKVGNYLLSPEKHKFHIDQNWENKADPAKVFVNYLVKNPFISTDTEGRPLEGGEFTLYKVVDGVETEIAKFTTPKDGKFLVENLDYGNYVIKQTKVPEGFNKADDYPFTIDENYKGNVPEVRIINIPNHFEFMKVNKQGQALAGAEFTIYRYEDKITNVTNEAGTTNVTNTTNKTSSTELKEYAKVKSDSNGIVSFKELVPGRYVIKETSAPNGYYQSKETIELNLDKKYVSNKEVFKFTNEAIPPKATDKPGKGGRGGYSSGNRNGRDGENIQTGVEGNTLIYIGIALAVLGCIGVAGYIVITKRKKH